MQKTHHNYATCMNFLNFPNTVKHPTCTSHAITLPASPKTKLPTLTILKMPFQYRLST